jgi:GAF domain-containing protein
MDHCGILVVDKDNYFHDLAAIHPDIDGSDVNRILNEQGLLQRSGMAFEGSALQETMQRLEEVRQPVIFDYSADNSIYSEHQLLSLLHQKGYQEAMAGLLKTGGKAFGCFFINFVVKGQAPHTEITLFQNVVDQLSVAVANILANEEILEREREKTLLLEVSRAIAKIDNKVDLLHCIDELLVPIFHHSDAGVLVVDREKQYVVDYHALYADVIPATPIAQAMNAIAQEQGQVRMPLPGSLVEWAMGQPPMVGKLADLLESGYDAPYLNYEIANGLTHYLCAPLTVSGNTFGFFDLLFKEAHQPDASRLPLFAQIADVIAVALSNILANEEILEREREKSRLLEISQAIASVQNHKQLLKVIYQKIKPVFPYDNAGLFVFDQTGENYYEILHAEVLPDKVQAQLTEAGLLGPYPYRGHPPAAWVYAGQPAIYSLVEQAELFAPGSAERATFEIGLSGGLRQMIGGPLYCGGKKIGLISFNAKQDNFYTGQDVPLFQAVADQVAVAVANILANEEILAREREKSRLLEISQAISQISQREDLLKVIIRHVQPLFGFDENALFVIDRDRKQYRMWYDNLVQPYEEGKRSQQGAGIPMEGNQVAADVFQDRPAYLRDREEMLAFSTGNASLTEWIVASGTEEVMIGPLKVGGQIIGCFNSHSRRKGTFTTPMLPLYQNVCDQIAVAVANILANEEILEREREKSILLSISESLATIRDKQQLLKVVFEKVRPLFGFYDTGLFVLDSDRQYIEDWTVTLPEADPSEANIRLRSQDAGRIGFKDSAMEWAINQLKGVEGPEIFPYNEETFARFPEYPQFAVIKQIGYKESLAALLRTNQGELGILFFNSLTEGHFQVAQFTLFQAIADQVAVAVANILANEEI